MALDPSIYRAYNPTPIQSPQNVLMQGAQLQRAQQENALLSMRMQNAQQEQAQAMQQAQAEQAQRAAQQATLQSLPASQSNDPRAAVIRQMVQAGLLKPDALPEIYSPNYGRQEVARTATVAGQGGMPELRQLDKYGGTIGQGMPEPVKMQLENMGGSMMAVNPYQLQGGQTFKRTQTPDSIASNAVQMRGQNMTDARARQTLQVQQATAGAEMGGPQQAQLSAQFGKAAPGYRWKADGSQEAIPGGPADRKNTDAGIREGRQREASIAQAGRVIAKVDQALADVGYSTAGPGSVFSGIPGTTARNLDSTLQTIKANLGFAELQAMRDASPTGGALGAIAVQELIALQSTVASLDQGQSPPQLRKSLGDIKRHYTAWKDAVSQAGNGEGTDAAVRTATNPQTGEKLQLVNGQWVPAK